MFSEKIKSWCFVEITVYVLNAIFVLVYFFCEL